jgi:hypothetical protein
LVNFSNAIDTLTEDELRAFHVALVQDGCYEGLLNLKEIEDGRISLRDAVKIGVQGAGYEKLKEIGPESIRKEIETIDNKPVVITTEEDSGEGEEKESESDAEPGVTKEKLILELIGIWKSFRPGRGLPPELQPRYGQILILLSEKHHMTQLEIQDATKISNMTIGKAIARWKKAHPIKSPDQAVAERAQKVVEKTVTERVTDEADRIIEEDIKLALHIRETYLKDAYLRGISLMELVDTAIPIWFDLEGIYNTMLNMERNIIALREYSKKLEARNDYLTKRCSNLNMVLISRA